MRVIMMEDDAKGKYFSLRLARLQTVWTCAEPGLWRLSGIIDGSIYREIGKSGKVAIGFCNEAN